MTLSTVFTFVKPAKSYCTLKILYYILLKMVTYFLKRKLVQISGRLQSQVFIRITIIALLETAFELGRLILL